MIKSTVLLYLVIGIGIGIGIGYLGLNPQVNELQGSIQYKDEQIRDLRQEQISNKNNIATLEFNLTKLDVEINNQKQDIVRLDKQINELDNEITRRKVNEELDKEEIKKLKDLKNEMELEKTILQVNINNLTVKYDKLKEIWDLWDKHRNVAPVTSNILRYSGKCTEGCYLNQDSLVFSTSQSLGCLQLGRGEGWSMAPALPSSNSYYIETTCFTRNDLNVGDMIAYECEFDWCKDQMILHQIIEIQNEGYLMKGIHNTEVDGVIRFEDIISKVVLIIL